MNLQSETETISLRNVLIILNETNIYDSYLLLIYNFTGSLLVYYYFEQQPQQQQ